MIIQELLNLSDQILTAASEEDWQSVEVLDTERRHLLEQLGKPSTKIQSIPELPDQIKTLRDQDQRILELVKQARDSVKEVQMSALKVQKGLNLYQQQS